VFSSTLRDVECVANLSLTSSGKEANSVLLLPTQTTGLMLADAVICILCLNEHTRQGPLAATIVIKAVEADGKVLATGSAPAASLRYSVQFDRGTMAKGDPVRCAVHAERVGFRGYGMMLAEVGLPPGAEVDRASLDEAVSSTWDVQSYEIQPDRIALYVWPRAGGTTFSFTLKPRFAMKAQSPESILDDYYNPEARASVPPTRFIVR
jgi:hypothetical protein